MVTNITKTEQESRNVHNLAASFKLHHTENVHRTSEISFEVRTSATMRTWISGI